MKSARPVAVPGSLLALAATQNRWKRINLNSVQLAVTYAP
jgi:hypothetical protein